MSDADERIEQRPPTLSDVAQQAGVSLATADRVVNKRPGVRAETIRRVEQAVADLGFERNLGAAQLARRVRHRVMGLLPEAGGNPFMARLRQALEEASHTGAGRHLDLTIQAADTFQAEPLAAAILEAGTVADAIVAVGLDHPAVREAIDAVVARGVPVATLVSDVPGSARLRYVGIDNRAAGRVAAHLLGRFAGGAAGEILVVLGSRDLRDHRDRLDGFREALAERFPLIDVTGVVEGQDEPAATRQAVARILQRQPRPLAIYSAGAGNAGLCEALAERDLKPVVVAHELTPETRPLLVSGRIDALIVQDPGHEARSALRVVEAALSGARIDERQERIRVEILLPDNLPD
ncbi:LacI family DNA-binding transcriptional regulator [Aureimonas jatrophae]|uniref:Transcriptional regulator, LacI family n=1 Tax=Aureimonas jatrophae TaxID=1166073 RepID=A0A1H0NJL1_9HYPH|nr:LacI family DNA-binding transcriptional regulator [Aureimonas jatrophae]MBB3948925.1 LacI family transcriptional regulator [Aureimonas jatrophae]SDO92811.1 transcriptional regulator, LacI family [Aureimonas jatrophae]